jgi:hypothetical protein
VSARSDRENRTGLGPHPQTTKPWWKPVILRTSFPLMSGGLESIERRLPRGWKLPASFRALAEYCQKLQRGAIGWFALGHTDPKSLVGTDVRAALVPFLKFPDGGFVAFWFQERGAPTLVSLLSEGEAQAVGATWDDFLQRLLAGRTGLEDLDDREGDVGDISSLQSRSYRPKSLSAHQRAYRAWLKQHAPKPEKLTRARAEEIRAAIFRVLKKRLRERCDTEHLMIDYTARTYRVSWYAGGLQPFPDAAALRGPLTKLKQALGRALKKSDMVVWGNGTVIFEKNTFIGKHMKV